MRNFDGIGLMKAVLWEEAKGKLRAIAAADGSQKGGLKSEDGLYRFVEIQKAVEDFISKFEGEGLQE